MLTGPKDVITVTRNVKINDRVALEAEVNTNTNKASVRIQAKNGNISLTDAVAVADTINKLRLWCEQEVTRLGIELKPIEIVEEKKLPIVPPKKKSPEIEEDFDVYDDDEDDDDN